VSTQSLSASGGDVQKAFTGAAGSTFSEWVRSQASETWERMVGHRFARDVAADSLPSGVLQRYLLYEHDFVEVAVTIFGYALVKAPTISEKTRLGLVIRELTTDQLTYFDRVFAQLGVTPEMRRAVSRPPTVMAFREGMLALAAHRTYEEIIGGMTAAEWMYHTWCSDAHARGPRDPVAAEWVKLHVAQPFADQVAWMRGQLDRYGPSLAPWQQERIAESFRRTLELEIGFHDAPYQLETPEHVASKETG